MSRTPCRSRLLSKVEAPALIIPAIDAGARPRRLGRMPLWPPTLQTSHLLSAPNKRRYSNRRSLGERARLCPARVPQLWAADRRQAASSTNDHDRTSTCVTILIYGRYRNNKIYMRFLLNSRTPSLAKAPSKPRPSSDGFSLSSCAAG